MVLISTALYFEAKPIIKHYNLKPLPAPRGLSRFGNPDTELIVTGTGKVAAACGTTMLAHLAKDAKACVNIGICGSKHHAIGSILHIDQILDDDNEKAFYPDVFTKSDFEKASLRTLSTSDCTQSFDETVDREASGFFEAANLFFDPSQIHVLKIVSDNADTKILDKEKIELLLESKYPEIYEYIENLRNLDTNETKFTPEELEMIQKYIDDYRFTATEQHSLKELLWNLKIQSGDKLKNILKKSTKYADAKQTKYTSSKLLRLMEDELKSY